MKKILTILLAVYFVVSWKQFAAELHRGNPNIVYDTWPQQHDGDSCGLVQVDQSERFQSEKDAESFAKILMAASHNESWKLPTMEQERGIQFLGQHDITVKRVEETEVKK